jgi:hypothetical protein
MGCAPLFHVEQTYKKAIVDLKAPLYRHLATLFTNKQSVKEQDVQKSFIMKLSICRFSGNKKLCSYRCTYRMEAIIVK